jgi:hypothetical protein
VQIVLDNNGVASRVAIRYAVRTTDDLPPLSCGRLSAARLRTAVDLLGLLERMIFASRIRYAPGALVSMVHLKRVRRAQASTRTLKPGTIPELHKPQTRATHRTTAQAPVSSKRLPLEPRARTLDCARRRNSM